MKKNILILLFFLLVPSALARAESPLRKETFTYALKDTDTLRMDRYDIPDGRVKPCVIFMFGGGFTHGTRDNARYMDYFDFLAGEGFTVVSIDYRLGFKKFFEAGRINENTANKEFLDMFEQTIFMAVEDLFDATNYILDNAAEWGVDPETIVISGSSAGAISVLQGEYERCNRSALAETLPEDFRYAGVVAFAGAIYSNRGHLEWNGTPAPVQLFHGDADMNVPFGKLKFGKLGFFGSQHIAEKYAGNGFPYYLYVEENGDHRLAGSPMVSQHEEIASFLKKYVLEKQPLATETVMTDSRVPAVKNKKFGIKTYAKANFAQ